MVVVVAAVILFLLSDFRILAEKQRILDEKKRIQALERQRKREEELRLHPKLPKIAKRDVNNNNNNNNNSYAKKKKDYNKKKTKKARVRYVLLFYVVCTLNLFFFFDLFLGVIIKN